MATKRRPGNHRELSEVAKALLRDVRDDFTSKGLSAHALTQQYDGILISELQGKYCVNAGVTQVDFDLALKELEGARFVRTGPMVPYENRPGSLVVFVGFYSKREYVCLTEAGYRAAVQMVSQKPRSSSSHVHISGGTFQHSQIGIGEQVTQMQKVDIANEAEVMARLTELLMTTGKPVDEAAKAELAQLVRVAHQGDSRGAKPIFHGLFGLASETVKQTAWGILTAIITKALGM